MSIFHSMESCFQMSDDVWARHANPWSVWTRYPCVPLFALAIWSRVWLGWYSLIPISLVLLWTWLNPRFFSKPKSTKHWASKAVMGERIWLQHPKAEIPTHHLTAIKYINGPLAISFVMAVYGLIALDPYLTVIGTVLTLIFKTWFLDRMVWLHQDLKDTNEIYQSWDYD